MFASKHRWVLPVVFGLGAGCGGAPESQPETLSQAGQNLTTCETVTRVKDIHPTGSSSIHRLQEAHGRLFFRADDGTTGLELWTSDGTEAGTGLVKDISPGTSSGYGGLPNKGGALSGGFFFSAGPVASDGTTDSELWTTNGTGAGTFRVKDIRPGTTGSSIEGVTRLGDTLFFAATNGTHGTELWKSDGTAAGTVMVKDLNTATGSTKGTTAASYPRSFTVVGGKLFFTAETGAGRELWVTDGTAAGTVLVKDIYPGSSGAFPAALTAVGSTLYFMASDGTTGQELWKSDGTAAGTVRVADVNPGTTSGAFSILGAVDGTVFFVGWDGVNGKELWKTDGTAAGTAMVKDFYPGSANGSFTLFNKTWNGSLYFGVQPDGPFAAMRRHELWKTDGTPEGTVFLANPQNASMCMSYACPEAFEFLEELNGTLYFGAGTGSIGQELWKTDGTPEGTKLVMDVEPGSGSGVSGTAGFALLDGSLYFAGTELWRITPQACP